MQTRISDRKVNKKAVGEENTLSNTFGRAFWFGMRYTTKKKKNKIEYVTKKEWQALVRLLVLVRTLLNHEKSCPKDKTCS